MTLGAAMFMLKSLESQLAAAGVSPDEQYDEIQIISNEIRLTRGSKTLYVPLAEITLLSEWHKS